MNTIDEQIQMDLEKEVQDFFLIEQSIKLMISEKEIRQHQEIQSKRVSRIETLTRLLE